MYFEAKEAKKSRKKYTRKPKEQIIPESTDT